MTGYHRRHSTALKAPSSLAGLACVLACVFALTGCGGTEEAAPEVVRPVKIVTIDSRHRSPDAHVSGHGAGRRAG